MAEVTRVKKVQTVLCPKCGFKTVRHVVKKGPGG